VLAHRHVRLLGVLALVLGAWNGYVAGHAGGVVEGRVVGPGGQHVEGALVILSERTLTTLEPRARVTTGPDGAFRFAGQPAHHFALEASKAGLGRAPRTLHRRWFRGQDVRLDAPLRLEPGP
jgi:hypothetical protein